LLRKYRKFVLLVILATTPLSLAADRERVKEVAGQLMCICGCNQVLGVCNHINCPTSGGMMKEVEKELDSGKSDKAVLDHFVGKFGLSVLSAPPTSGFNLTAWLMPFAALLAGAVAAVYFLRRFRASWVATGPKTVVDTSKYQSQIEEELKKYTPED
jgi:cytochrome c-type biogenesis protein CcmH/NrfF